MLSAARTQCGNTRSGCKYHARPPRISAVMHLHQLACSAAVGMELGSPRGTLILRRLPTRRTELW